MTTPAPKAQGRQRRPRKFSPELYSKIFLAIFPRNLLRETLTETLQRSTKFNEEQQLFQQELYQREPSNTNTYLNISILCPSTSSHLLSGNSLRILPFFSFPFRISVIPLCVYGPEPRVPVPQSSTCRQESRVQARALSLVVQDVSCCN